MHVIDSHTGGEPTRVILDGAPDLGTGPLAERAKRLADSHHAFRNAVLREPRGQPAMVAVVPVPPTRSDCLTGAIYFDAGAVLGMCGHATIGLAVTLAHLGRISLGSHRIETPAGMVEVTLDDPNTVTLQNIESRRVRKSAPVTLPGQRRVTGDVAYGGNWFFIVDPSPLSVTVDNIPALTDLSIALREAANAQGIGGEAGQPIDHVILNEPHPDNTGQHRNFTLCPDNDYDRSPCGTGSSARLACLAADGLLPPDTEIVQHSVIGSQYRLSYQPGACGSVVASIVGQAFVHAETRLFFDPRDPFNSGITT